MEQDHGLIERLDAIANHDWRFSLLAHTSDTAKEAASALAIEQEKVRRLREALEPFAEAAKNYEGKIDALVVFHQAFCVRDFRNALAALNDTAPEVG